jgi:predicted transcriptional regulator
MLVLRRSQMARPRGAKGHRKPSTREQDLATIMKLDRRGYSQHEIAKVIGVSQSQISVDLKLVRSRYKEVSAEEYRTKVEEKRAQYREIRKEAWRAWERSKKEALKVVEEERVTPEGNELAKTVTTKEQRLPDSGYLRIIIESLRDESALDGLNQPQKLNINANVIDWGELFRRTADNEVDQVERRLAEIEQEMQALPTPQQAETANLPPGG